MLLSCYLRPSPKKGESGLCILTVFENLFGEGFHNAAHTPKNYFPPKKRGRPVEERGTRPRMLPSL